MFFIKILLWGKLLVFSELFINYFIKDFGMGVNIK